MTENNQNMSSDHNEKDTVFGPANDLQVVMQNGFPVSVIVPMEEYDKMVITIQLAQELLEGKDLVLSDGTKGTFQEIVDQQVMADRAAYEEELASMFEDCDDQDCDQEEQD